ncbi:unnamed protein product [Meganyctiphanes norvegica]|uniref:CCHC-type domain-containing protein n=1 Tax=Meganyctiphanes norvegica TaxID=48144 RepID=A0AAV2SNV6_MEGNR
MAELEEMKELVAQMVRENARLVQALARAPAPAPLDPAVIRAEKVAKLSLALRKSHKVKDFKDTSETNIREWLKRFDQEAGSLKKMSGINDDLTRAEYIEVIKDKLEYQVVKRLDTVFVARQPAITWEAVTTAELHTCLKEEFGSKETDVSSLLCQFGPNRMKKTPEVSVNEFYHSWQEQLPDCMNPVTDVAKTEFVDLVRRSLFYFCLEDKYLQEQLCSMKDAEPSLKKYFDEAVAAEAKRRSFQEIGVSSSHLDSSAGVSVNKWEASGKSGRFSERGSQKLREADQRHVQPSSQPGPQVTRQQNTTQKRDSQLVSHGTTDVKSRYKPGKCYNCHRFGHWASECRSEARQRFGNVNQASVTSASQQVAEEEEPDQQTNEDFNAFNVVSVMEAGKFVNTFATRVGSPLITNEPMMTRCVLQDVGRVKFECDTAASHSVLSKAMFDKVKAKCQVHLKPEQVTIRLADGTLSDKSCGSVQLNVQKYDGSPEVCQVTFFVLEGPNCLLGRYALQQLWPEQYLALREVAGASIAKWMPVSKTPVKLCVNPGLARSHNGRSMIANEVGKSSEKSSVNPSVRTCVKPCVNPGLARSNNGRSMIANEVGKSSDQKKKLVSNYTGLKGGFSGGF